MGLVAGRWVSASVYQWMSYCCGEEEAYLLRPRIESSLEDIVAKPDFSPGKLYESVGERIGSRFSAESGLLSVKIAG